MDSATGSIAWGKRAGLHGEPCLHPLYKGNEEEIIPFIAILALGDLYRVIELD